jgi:hypothetical protein
MLQMRNAETLARAWLGAKPLVGETCCLNGSGNNRSYGAVGQGQLHQAT